MEDVLNLSTRIKRFSLFSCASVWWCIIMHEDIIVWQLFFFLFVYHHNHHHHDALLARICDPLLLLISIVHRSNKVFQATSCIGTELLYIGSTFAHPFEGVHWSILLMSSFLLLKLCPACLVCLTQFIFMCRRWPY